MRSGSYMVKAKSDANYSPRKYTKTALQIGTAILIGKRMTMRFYMRY